MIPQAWLIAAAALLLALAGAFAAGQHGEANAWRAKQLEAEQAAEALAEQQRLRSRAAQTAYEAQRAAAARRLTQPSPEASNALHAPICPPAGPAAALELGDVPVPDAVLQRLRAAGADF